MTTPETKARAGEGLSPAEDLNAAMTGFMGDFRRFATDIQVKLQQQDERMTKLDRKSMLAGAHRPALSAQAEQEAPHQKAFAAYLRSGDDDGLRGLEVEGKAFQIAVASDGGFLVAPQMADRIRHVLNATSSVRSVANVVQIDGTSLDFLIDRAELGANWATEVAATTETATGTLERINIPLHELAAMPKASHRLLDDTAFDVEEYLGNRIAERFVRTEAQAFVAGNGTDKPRGFMDYPRVANASWTWGNLGFIVSGNAATITGTDPLVDMIYALGAAYRQGASWVMNSRTAGVLRKLKDADGRYLWADGLTQGEPARLLGYPVLIAEDMPDIAANAHPVAFGNFNAGYTIVERPDLRVLRDPFSAKPHVLFYATKRVGGAVTDFAAIKVLRISV
jgi:HK97 family phage major capsid protein